MRKKQIVLGSIIVTLISLGCGHANKVFKSKRVVSNYNDESRIGEQYNDLTGHAMTVMIGVDGFICKIDRDDNYEVQRRNRNFYEGVIKSGGGAIAEGTGSITLSSPYGRVAPPLCANRIKKDVIYRYKNGFSIIYFRYLKPGYTCKYPATYKFTSEEGEAIISVTKSYHRLIENHTNLSQFDSLAECK